MHKKEKMALAKAATITGRGVWQVVPYFIDMETQLKNIQELGDISLETGIMCTFQPVLSTPDAPKAERIMEALQKREIGEQKYSVKLCLVALT